MLTSKVEKVTFGLLLLLAFVGNLGVVEAATASQGVSIPVLALTAFATVRFGYTGRVILSWFELNSAIGWLLGPGLVACILYLAFTLHPEDAEEAADEDGD